MERNRDMMDRTNRTDRTDGKSVAGGRLPVAGGTGTGGRPWMDYVRPGARAARVVVGWWLALAVLAVLWCWPAGLLWLAMGPLAGMGGLAVCWLGCFAWAAWTQGNVVFVCGRELRGMGGLWFLGPCEGVALGCEDGVFRRVLGPIWLRSVSFCRHEPRMFLDEEGDVGPVPNIPKVPPPPPPAPMVVPDVPEVFSPVGLAEMGVSLQGLFAENGKLMRRLRAAEGALAAEVDRHGCVEGAWREERRLLRGALEGALGLAMECGASREDARFENGAVLVCDGKEG